MWPNLEQVAESAERAYQRISSELQHNVPFKVPLILFKTRNDFAQQSIIPEVGGAGAIARGDVTSFSEPRRNRVAILVEEEPDRLYRLITHELTHIFAFDIIPRSTTNVRRVAPWIDEGFAEYMAGVWDPDHLQQMRELVLADRVPKMFALTGSVDGQPHVVAANQRNVLAKLLLKQFDQPSPMA